jgi:hypothetical protein
MILFARSSRARSSRSMPQALTIPRRSRAWPSESSACLNDQRGITRARVAHLVNSRLPRPFKCFCQLRPVDSEVVPRFLLGCVWRFCRLQTTKLRSSAASGDVLAKGSHGNAPVKSDGEEGGSMQSSRVLLQRHPMGAITGRQRPLCADPAPLSRSNDAMRPGTSRGFTLPDGRPSFGLPVPGSAQRCRPAFADL